MLHRNKLIAGVLGSLRHRMVLSLFSSKPTDDGERPQKNKQFIFGQQQKQKKGRDLDDRYKKGSHHQLKKSSVLKEELQDIEAPPKEHPIPKQKKPAVFGSKPEKEPGKKMFFGQNVKKQERVKQSVFMDEFSQSLQGEETAVTEQKRESVLAEKLGLVKLMGESRTKYHHMIALLLEMGQTVQMLEVYDKFRKEHKQPDDQIDNLVLEGLLKENSLSQRLQEVASSAQFIYPQLRAQFLSLVVATQEQSLMQRHLPLVRDEMPPELSPDYSAFLPFLQKEIKGEFDAESSLRLSLFVKYWTHSNSNPVDISQLLSMMNQAFPQEVMLSTPLEENDQVEDLRWLLIECLLQQNRLSQEYVDLSQVASFLRFVVLRQDLLPVNHVLQNTRDIHLSLEMGVEGLSREKVEEGYVNVRNQAHLTGASMLFYLRAGVASGAVSVCLDLYQHHLELLQTTPEKAFLQAFYAQVIAMCAHLRVQGDTNLNLLRQVLGQAKEQGLPLESLLGHSQFQVVMMQCHILDGDLEAAAKVLEGLLREHSIQRTRQQMKIMLYEVHEYQDDLRELDGLVDRLSDDQIWTLYQDNSTLNKMIQSYSGKPLAEFWHSTERLSKIQRAAQAVGNLDQEGAKARLQALCEVETHPLLKADYLFVLEDFENLLAWSMKHRQEHIKKALRLQLLEEMATTIMTSEKPIRYRHLNDRLAEAKGILAEGQNSPFKTANPKKTKKMIRKKGRELRKAFKEDPEEAILGLMQGQRKVLEQVINTTQYMKEQRRARGEHDTLYHLDDPATYQDFMDNLEDQDPQDILSVFRELYDSAGPHVHLPDDPVLTGEMRRLALWGVEQEEPMAIQLCEKYHCRVNVPLPGEVATQLDQFYRFRVLDEALQKKMKQAHSVLGGLQRDFLYQEAPQDTLRTIFNPLEEGFLNKMRMHPELRDQAEYRLSHGPSFIYEDNLSQSERLALRHK